MNINSEVKLNIPDYNDVLLPDDFLQSNSIQVSKIDKNPLFCTQNNMFCLITKLLTLHTYCLKNSWSKILNRKIPVLH